MARFTLVLRPDGKALLVTPETLLPEYVEQLKRLWTEWQEGHRDILFVGGTDVRLVEDIELEIGDEDGREE